MKDRAEVVVIGAGIMGLSIAYHLARAGTTDVVVVDRTYLCGGASGRNGGGVRAQWSSEANVRLMQESIRLRQDVPQHRVYREPPGPLLGVVPPELSPDQPDVVLAGLGYDKVIYRARGLVVPGLRISSLHGLLRVREFCQHPPVHSPEEPLSSSPIQSVSARVESVQWRVLR